VSTSLSKEWNVSNNIGRTAIVTGASKGIGAGIAKALAASGAAVAVNYRGDAEGADRVVADITAAGGRAIAVQADVARRDDVNRLFARAREEFGPVDILVNNAGAAAFVPVTGVTEEQFQHEFGTNLLGPVLTTQALADQGDIGAASVVNVSSAGALTHPPMTALYTASKAALNAFTVVAAKELGPRGIRVNAIMPGPSDTEGARGLGSDWDAFEAQMAAATPLGRMARPDDYGPIVAFLASDDAQWITGDVMLASGGLR
jgi:3-oxoacyl-[acyl-carrier protein] reductase